VPWFLSYLPNWRNIRCDHEVIDTYLSLRYICYNYCGPVYLKLNFEALRVLRQCEPPSVFASCQNHEVIHVTLQSYQLIIIYVIQGLELCPLKITVNDS